MPLMLALVVRVELHSMNGIDVPYVGSFVRARAFVPSAALMPLVLALVVRARAFIPSIALMPLCRFSV